MNENIPKAIPHYLQSSGSIVEDVKGVKKTMYFYPSLVFPNSIEICSVSLIFDNKVDNVKLNMVSFKKRNTPISSDCLTHPNGDLSTTKIYGKPKFVSAYESFYFYNDGEIKDSSIVIAFKTVN